MPTIPVIDRLWLHSVIDPLDFIALRVSNFSPLGSIPGSFEVNAGDRIRLIIYPGATESMTATLVRPSADERQWLKDHKGKRLTVLDKDGGKFVGAYLQFGYSRPVEAWDLSDNVELTISEVTFSEAV